jgi:hypothetical protein
MIRVLNSIYGGDRFHFDGTQIIDKGAHLPGFWLNKDGILKASGAKISGRIEADEGYFKANLETPVLQASTSLLYSDIKNFNAGTSLKNLVLNEFVFWGIPTNTSSVISIPTKKIIGMYDGNLLSTIDIIYDGSRSVVDGSGIILTFSDNTKLEYRVSSQPTLPKTLSFRYIADGWNVSIKNIPLYDPKIPNMLWKDGTDLKISNG